MSVFSVLFCAAICAGNQGLYLFRIRFVKPAEELLFSYAVGLVFLSYLVLVLGIAGLLVVEWLWVGVALLLLFGALRARHIVELLLSCNVTMEGGIVERWLRVVFWICVTWIGLCALIPPFGTDALTYHLTCPKLFLQMQSVGLISDELNSHFPFFMEMLFTLGLALDGEIVAQLFHWSIGVLLVISVGSFFERYFGSRKWGRVAAILLLLTPGIFNEMRSALVDVAFVAYNFFGFSLMVIGVQEQNKRYLWFSFFMLAVTLGIKYLAVLSVFTVVVAMVYLGFSFGWNPKRVGGCLFRFGVVAVIVSGYWYVRAYWTFGNPFYPYFNPLFGLEVLGNGARAPGDYSDIGVGTSWTSLIQLPFQLTLFPTRFDGWAEQIGPFYLVFLPFVFWGKFSRVRVAVAVCALLYVLGCLRLGQVTRFFYPALPFFIIMIVAGLADLERRGHNLRLHKVLIVLVALFPLALMAYHGRQGLWYVVGMENRDAFLLRHERSYGVAQFINQNLPREAKILNAEEVRTYYFDRRLVRESLYRWRTAYDHFEDEGDILLGLKQDGFTHVLVTDDNDEEAQGIRRLVTCGEELDGMATIFRTSFRERNGRVIHYHLYRLV